MFGSVLTLTHLPVTGTQIPRDSNLQRSSSLPQFGPHGSGGKFHVESESSAYHSHSRVPKVNFPGFVGENPKLWISHCRDYFDLYHVDSSDWIKILLMHFSEAAARWLQSIEPRLRSLSWDEFCSLVLERFGCDEHALLIRQLFHIRQTGLVADYVAKFTELVDQLRSYQSSNDPLYFALHFIDGLKEDIRAIVMVQHPSDLHTACVLAQLQEEVLEPMKDFRKPEFFSSGRAAVKAPLPLPLPPKVDKGGTPSHVADHCAADAFRPRPFEDKLSALCAYHRARGLCEKCVEKWSRDPRCSEPHPHVLQELWDLCQLDDPAEGTSSPDDSVSADQLMSYWWQRFKVLLVLTPFSFMVLCKTRRS